MSRVSEYVYINVSIVDNVTLFYTNAHQTIHSASRTTVLVLELWAGQSFWKNRCLHFQRWEFDRNCRLCIIKNNSFQIFIQYEDISIRNL